jgi:hypothetical protein
LAYDVLKPGLLYAGTASSEVMLFNTKRRSTDGIQCTLMEKKGLVRALSADGSTVKNPLHANVKIATQLGYMLAFVGRHAHIYNSTDVTNQGLRSIGGGKIGAASKDEDDTAEVSEPVFVAASISSSRAQAIQALVVVGDKVSSDIFESLLPWHPPGASGGMSDISWLRSPLLVGGLVAVFGYQFYNKKQGGGGGGGAAGLPPDFEATMKRFGVDTGGMSGMGGGGGGMGGMGGMGGGGGRMGGGGGGFGGRRR